MTESFPHNTGVSGAGDEGTPPTIDVEITRTVSRTTGQEGFNVSIHHANDPEAGTLSMCSNVEGIIVAVRNALADQGSAAVPLFSFPEPLAYQAGGVEVPVEVQDQIRAAFDPKSPEQ